VRALLAAVTLLAACGSALAQATACNPSAPRLDPGAGFVPFGANEQAHARGGNAGPGWEWALGTDTEAGQKAKGSLDWVSGRIYDWTLVYSGTGAATLEVRDAGAPKLSLSYPSGMDAGNALELQVATNPSIGPDTTIAATLTSLQGQAVAGSISQTGNSQESFQRLYVYHPSMAGQGFAAKGTVSLTYSTLPAGSRVDFKLRAGTLPCSNVAPTVSIGAPAANSLFHAPASISIESTVSDADGTVAQVEFFADDRLIGTAASAPFGFNWTNVAAGAYSLTARATDDAGDQMTSAAVPILVNAPPTVILTSPMTNTFTAPASVPVSAEAADADGTIVSVAFYHGETLITTLTSPPYSVTWTAVPEGTYNLTARAADDRGATTSSTPLPITVNPAAPAVQALYFIHVDHLNAPRLLTDSAGTAVWRWDQAEPFGNNVSTGSAAGFIFEFPIRLPGQYFDQETTLHYNARRNYDATIGRYVESDPIGIWGGLNTYAYVGNRPLTYIDPTGLRNIHGNWCGPGGSGPILDPVDQCCYDHDSCYGACGATWRDKVFGTKDPKRRTEMQSCDRSVCACLADVDPTSGDQRRGKARVEWFFKCVDPPKANSGGKKGA
jgi:RHS repeat-associated protein